MTNLRGSPARVAQWKELPSCVGSIPGSIPGAGASTVNQMVGLDDRPQGRASREIALSMARSPTPTCTPTATGPASSLAVADRMGSVPPLHTGPATRAARMTNRAALGRASGGPGVGATPAGRSPPPTVVDRSRCDFADLRCAPGKR